jgi:FkbM family methyltransferase
MSLLHQMIEKPPRLLKPVIGFARRLRAFVTWSPYQVVSYAQEGEDLILNRMFAGQNSGFFVDVGAHHPLRFSNTYLLYSRGWRGINIDARPGSMHAFAQCRPRDINLEMPVMKQRGRLTYYQFNEPALNGFSKELSNSRHGINGYQIIRETEMEGAPLGEILQEHLPKGQAIDVLSVDVEGLDLEVLQSNDWTRFRPKVILVEILSGSLGTVERHQIHQFLTGRGYQIFAKIFNTAIFLSDEYLQERARVGA